MLCALEAKLATPKGVKQITKDASKTRKAAKKASNEKAKAPKKDQALEELKRIQETAAMGACILEMLSTLETQAMNEVRQKLASFRLTLAQVAEQHSGSDKPCHYEQLPLAITSAWNLYKAGYHEKAKLVFVNILSTPKKPTLGELFIKSIDKQEAKESPTQSQPTKFTTPPTPPPEDQYDSGIEEDMIDSPSLYMLPNQDYLNETVAIKQEVVEALTHSSQD